MHKLSFAILVSPIQCVVLPLEPFENFWRKMAENAMFNFGLNIEQDLVIRYAIYRLSLALAVIKLTNLTKK